MSYTCPKCGATSYNPNDEFYGYCGNCHQFTRGVRYGDQRHRSSSTPAGQEREMRMPTNDEEGKAQPEMPEVQRQGISGSLRNVPWQRVESNHEQDVLAMQRTRVSIPTDPKRIAMPQMSEYPSRSRYYWGTTALGMATGITWTAFMLSPLMLRHITRATALGILYGIAALIFVMQGWMVYRWTKELKKHRAEMAEFWDEMKLDPAQNPFRGKI